MFGIGGPELVIIIIVALLVIGPQKLPQVMRSLGKGLAEFRRMSTDIKQTLDVEVERAEMEEKKKKAKKELFPEGEKKVETAGKTEAKQSAAEAKVVAESSAEPVKESGEKA